MLCSLHCRFTAPSVPKLDFKSLKKDPLSLGHISLCRRELTAPMNHLILAEPSEIVPVVPFALTARAGVAQKEGL